MSFSLESEVSTSIRTFSDEIPGSSAGIQLMAYSFPPKSDISNPSCKIHHKCELTIWLSSADRVIISGGLNCCLATLPRLIDFIYFSYMTFS